MAHEVKSIQAAEAYSKMQDGTPLLDVRELPEWNEAHVPGARLLPVGQVCRQPAAAAVTGPVLVMCRSGKRATAAARALAEVPGVEPLVVEGGLEAWRQGGLPTQASPKPGMSLERQVRIGAGLLVLLGLVVPPVRFISWFVGCGLVFAGVTNFCGMAMALAKMPWNRPRGDEQQRSLQWACCSASDRP